MERWRIPVRGRTPPVRTGSGVPTGEPRHPVAATAVGLGRDLPCGVGIDGGEAVSTEIYLGGLSLPIPDDLTRPDSGDRVIFTAGDRPNTDTLPVLSDPAADHLDPQLAARRADVEEKHRRVAEFLDRCGYDALVLGRADSLAWFTSGGDLGQYSVGGDLGAIFVFINRTSRAVICDNVQTA